MASSFSWRQAVRSMDWSPPQWSARLRRDRLSTHSQCAKPRCCRWVQLKDTATREWRVRQAQPLMSTLCRCWFWPTTGSSSLSVTQLEQFRSDKFWRTLLSLNILQNASLGMHGPICKESNKLGNGACHQKPVLSLLTSETLKVLQLARYTWTRLWNCLLTLCRLTSCWSGRWDRICGTSTSSQGRSKRWHLQESKPYGWTLTQRINALTKTAFTN